jgi:tetratricopeptide (TPR) repeat protein
MDPRWALPGYVVEEVRSTGRGRSEEALGYLDSAVKLLEKGHPQRAIADAERAKAMAPRSASVREVLGLALYGAERYREASAQMQAYRRMSGREDQNHIAADCQRALGNPLKAVELASTELDAKVSDESRAEAAVVGASALSDLGRTDEALAFLRRYRPKSDSTKDHDLRVWYVAGEILARVGRRAEAAAEFRRIVRHDPAAFDAAERLAELG